MVQVEAASSQHSTPAGHHPIGFFLSKDEGAGIIHRNAMGAVRCVPLCLAGHLHQNQSASSSVSLETVAGEKGGAGRGARGGWGFGEGVVCTVGDSCSDCWSHIFP